MLQSSPCLHTIEKTRKMMGVHRTTSLLPHLELSELRNCTDVENPTEPKLYHVLGYIVCLAAIVLHIKNIRSTAVSWKPKSFDRNVFVFLDLTALVHPIGRGFNFDCYWMSLFQTTGSTALFSIITLTISMALAPLLLVVCGIFTIYRAVVSRLLSKEPNYRGLMEGSDAYWAGEETYARSVINILCMVDFSQLSRSGQRPIDAVREVMRRVLSGNSPHKLRCTMGMSRYGYYYLKDHTLNLTENVRFITPSLGGKADVENFVSKIANEPIIGHSFWEILVGQGEVVEGSWPLIFRVHHAFGDGYSLVQLFVNCMLDKDDKSKKLTRKESVLQRLLKGEYNDNFLYPVSSFVTKIYVYLHSPLVVARQLLTPPDRNSLHNKIHLSGRKICRWLEVDLGAVKQLKNALNCRFSDVLLTAVSNSLEDCFQRWGEAINTVKIVIPTRLPGESSNSMSTNRFTVAMLEIPLSGKREGKIRAISSLGNRLRTQPDFHINYWLLRVAFNIFPASIVSKVVRSTHCTLAISNVPGPTSATKLVGCDVRNLLFWLPNRDTTGVGISFLSYTNKLNIGVSVDAALVCRDDQVDEILMGIHEEIGRLWRTKTSNLEEQ